MMTTARVAAEPLTTLDKRATFNDLRNCKAKSVNVHVAGQTALLKLSTKDNGVTWRGEYAETKIVIRVGDHDTDVVFTSGGPKTRKATTVASREAISVDLSYLLAGYGAPISFVAAKHGLRVVSRVAGEDQLKTFGELFIECPLNLTFGGLRFTLTAHSEYVLTYKAPFDGRVNVVISFYTSTRDAQRRVNVGVEPLQQKLNHFEALRVRQSYYKQQEFDETELKQAFAFLENVIDQDEIKSAANNVFDSIVQRKRKRRVMTAQSRLWPEAIQINSVLLRRVKASRNHSNFGVSAPSITDKTLILSFKSVFSVKYESARTTQDGKKIYSFQLHIAPETGDFIIGWRGPSTNTVSARDGKVRHGVVGSPADLQKIIDATAKFLLPYMQKRNVTSQKQPSAGIINMRGADV